MLAESGKVGAAFGPFNLLEKEWGVERNFGTNDGWLKYTDTGQGLDWNFGGFHADASVGAQVTLYTRSLW